MNNATLTGHWFARILHKTQPITKQKTAITISGTLVLLVIRCKLQAMAHGTIFYIHKTNSQLKERRHHSSLDTGQRHPKQSAEAIISSLRVTGQYDGNIVVHGSLDKWRELTNWKEWGWREVDTQDEAYMFLPEFINNIVTYVTPLVGETKFPESITH